MKKIYFALIALAGVFLSAFVKKTASPSLRVWADGLDLESLEARAGEISERIESVMNLAESEARDLTAEELLIRIQRRRGLPPAHPV